MNLNPMTILTMRVLAYFSIDPRLALNVAVSITTATMFVALVNVKGITRWVLRRI